ncbi:MAG: nucleotide exchange factor GrpE [Nanoarchaeota archaeon]|nr:nucleotide exchange factor GrpE [Nanoarchaeota archaeon]
MAKQKDKVETGEKELIDTLQRVQADFENYKKRVEKEMQEFHIFANTALIEKLLAVLDNFDLAMKAEQNPKDFAKGVHLIFAEFKNILKDAGVTEIKTEGKTFDPKLHEAMMVENNDSKKDNIILEEFQKGYMIGNKVLRHAKVKVNKKGD